MATSRTCPHCRRRHGVTTAFQPAEMADAHRDATGHQASVEEASLAADAAEREAVTVYLRRRSWVAMVVEALRRAEAAARLDVALHQMAL
jgi:hypothetical protein